MSDDSFDGLVDETVVANELRKILDQELPEASAQDRQLYEELEQRIREHNQKMLSESTTSKKKSMKAKILAASNLARARGDIQMKKELLENVSDQAIDGNSKLESAKEEVIKKYKLSAPGNIRKNLEDENIFTYISDDNEEEVESFRQVAGYSPLEKLQRTVKKVQAASKFGAGDKKVSEESEEEMQTLTEESETWLLKQKQLEKELMARSSKTALKTKYMAKGSEGDSAERKLDELLERVVREGGARSKGKAAPLARAPDRKAGGLAGKQRTDMADVVKRAMALRQEADASTKQLGEKKAARKTAKKAFPVQLESSGSESRQSSSESSLEEDSDGDQMDLPDLLSASSDSSAEDRVPDRTVRNRFKPRYNFRTPVSFDYGEIDDVDAVEEAKRRVRMDVDQWDKPNKVGAVQTNYTLPRADKIPAQIKSFRDRLKLEDRGKQEEAKRAPSKTLSLARDKFKQGAGRGASKAPAPSAESPFSRHSERPSRHPVDLFSEARKEVKPQSKSKLEIPKPPAVKTKAVPELALKHRRNSIGSGRSMTKFI